MLLNFGLKSFNFALLMGAQYQYSSVGDQYNAMVYVKRRNTFHLDSSPDLFGEFKTRQSSQCSLRVKLVPTGPNGPFSVLTS